MMGSWKMALLVLAAVLGEATSAHAHGMPGPPCPRLSDWALGTSTAYAWHPTRPDGSLLGIDAAFFPHCLAWAGGGVRLFENLSSQDRAVLPYVEAGTWLFVNVGVGYTVDVTHGNFAPGRGAGFHVFVGEPIPVVGKFYVEPYYRVTYLGSDALNELGVLLKWTTWDFREH